MGRRDKPELSPSETELAEAEAATRLLLATYDEPAPVAPPPGLAARIIAAMPEAPQAQQPGRSLWAALRPAAWALGAAALVLLAIGGWGALVDSLGRVQVAGGPGGALGRLTLTLTLAARPLAELLAGAGAVPRGVLSAALALLALACCALCAAAWPKRTLGTAKALARAPGRSAGLGLLTTLLAALLLAPLAALLALSLIGLPLLAPLALALQLPYLFGLAGLGRAIGAGLGGGRLPAPLQAAVGTTAVLMPLAILGAGAPIAAAALYYVAAGVGLGAAMLSRGGAYAVRGAARL